MKKPRLAGEKTRQKLIAQGVDPAIANKPDLTLSDAYAYLYQQRENDTAAAVKAFWESLPDPPEGFLAVNDRVFGFQEVVGEDYYSDDVYTLYERRAFSEHQASAWACLVRNPENPYDEFAVEVRIDGVLVGHIPSDDSEVFSSALAELEKSFGMRICCPCIIDNGDDVWLVSTIDSIYNLQPRRVVQPELTDPVHDKYAHLFEKRSGDVQASIPEPVIKKAVSPWDLKSSRSNQCLGCVAAPIVFLIVFIVIGITQCRDTSSTSDSPRAALAVEEETTPAVSPELLAKARKALVNLEAGGLIKAYQKSTRNYMVAGLMWRKMTVQQKEMTVNTMAIPEMADAGELVSFEVRDWNTNKVYARYSGWSGVTILE